MEDPPKPFVPTSASSSSSSSSSGTMNPEWLQQVHNMVCAACLRTYYERILPSDSSRAAIACDGCGGVCNIILERNRKNRLRGPRYMYYTPEAEAIADAKLRREIEAGPPKAPPAGLQCPIAPARPANSVAAKAPPRPPARRASNDPQPDPMAQVPRLHQCGPLYRTNQRVVLLVPNQKAALKQHWREKCLRHVLKVYRFPKTICWQHLLRHLRHTRQIQCTILKSPKHSTIMQPIYSYQTTIGGDT